MQYSDCLWEKFICFTKKFFNRIGTIIKITQKKKEEKLQKSISKNFSWALRLREIDTDGSAPLRHLKQDLNLQGQDDRVPSLEKSKILRNADQTEGNYFLTPKLLKNRQVN